MLKQYLRDRRGILLLVFLFALIYTLVFTLFALPLSAVLYGTLLCFFVIGVAAAFDYYRYYMLHHTLRNLRDGIVYSVTALPSPRNQIERDYHDLIEVFSTRLCDQISQHDTARTEMADFYTLWVHQIKTPIAAMRLLLQRQADGGNAPQLQQELFKVERYVELVLGYLRMEDISSDLDLGEYRLETIVTQAVKKYAPVFVFKKIGIQMQNLDISVLTDEKWLAFVIEQLLSNALKYTAKGTIRLSTEPGPTFVLEDTGVGIHPEDLPRVFERGFTGFNGRMDQKATGLGLYLCKKTLDKLHHTIAITSLPGQGTCVRIGLARGDICVE